MNLHPWGKHTPSDLSRIFGGIPNSVGGLRMTVMIEMQVR